MSRETLDRKIAGIRQASAASVFSQFRPLPSLVPDVPSLTSDLLPAVLAEFIFDEAERACAPPEYVLAPLIVAIGNLIGGRVGIRLKAHDPWREFPNLWGATIGEPATLKSPMAESAFRSLRRIEHQMRETWETEVRPGLEQELAEIDIRLAPKKGRGARLDPSCMDPHVAGEELASLRRQKREVESALRAGPPRYSTSDVTQEKLAELLIANPGGMLLRRDELTGFLESLDRQGREGERAFYLEGWTARGSYDVDRIGRGSIHVPRVALGVFGTTQPGKFRRVVAGAVSGRGSADGFLQRFSVMLWPDQVPLRHVDRSQNLVAASSIDRLFEEIAKVGDWCSLGAEPTEPPTFCLDNEAQALFNTWHVDLLTRARAETTAALGEHIAKYPKLLAGLALIFHLVQIFTAGGARGPVRLHELRLAAALCDFMEAHARRVYGLADPARTGAHALAAKIKNGVITDGMPLREMYRAQWRGLKTSEEVDAAVGLLVDCGWVAIERGAPSPLGGQPSTVLRVNPEALR